MQNHFQHHPLRKLFAGLVENAFGVDVGMCDPKLNEYLVSLLLDFVHMDRVYKLRDAQGRPAESITAMLDTLQDRAGCTDAPGARDIHKHIGDFALFWTGVFPEGLRHQPAGVSPDHLLSYVDRGKESYYIASELFRDDSDPPGSLFRRLSAEFELCAHGLGLVRRRWENRGHDVSDGDRELLY